MSDISLNSLAKMIDHSLLHPTLSDQKIREGCELAKSYRVATVCVKPYSIELASHILIDSNVLVCAVIAFPHGNSNRNIKVAEVKDALSRGASEIDMVVNIGKVLSEDWPYVSDEIREINERVVQNQAILKVIFENDYLDEKHIIRLCEICSKCGVAFVKTSTGYGFVKQANGYYAYSGATDNHLKLMRRHCHNKVQVKAAGGIRTLDDLLRVRDLGASRIGASATFTILEEAKRRGFQ